MHLRSKLILTFYATRHLIYMQYALFGRQESVNRGWNNFISAIWTMKAEEIRTCIIMLRFSGVKSRVTVRLFLRQHE